MSDTFKLLSESLSKLAVDLKTERDAARAKLIEIIGCAEELGRTERMAPMYFNAADIEEMRVAAGIDTANTRPGERQGGG